MPDSILVGSTVDVGATMRGDKWSRTPLGDPAAWPVSLRNAVQLIRDSRFPMYVAWGPQLHLLYNDAYAVILGAKHPHSFGRPFWDIWPEVATEIRPVIAAALAGETVFTENQPLTLLRNGAPEATWFTYSVSPLRDDAGAVAGVFTVCDETGPRLAEERLQIALEAGAMGAWHWDLVSNTSRWLHGMAALHGLPAGTDISDFGQYAKLIHPKDRAAVLAEVRAAVDERREHRVEYRILLPDGGVRWVEGRGRLFFGADGSVREMAGICTDITRRKMVENDLQFLAQASMELARLVDPQRTMERLAQLAVPGFADWCAVDVLGEDDALHRLAVAHVDPAKVALAHELHRRYPPDPKGPDGTWSVLRSGAPLLVPDISDDMLAQSIGDAEQLQAISQLGLRSYIGVPLKTKERVFGVVTFIAAESGRRYGAAELALAEDLALRAAIAIENAQLYQAVQEADRRKDVFLATLSHELRNPLAPIVNAVTMLKLAPHERTKVERAVRMMERQVGQMVHLVDDLMDVARISAGKMELRKQAVSLSSVLHNAVETSRPHIDSAHHQLLIDLPGTPMELQADPVRLAQVFANLLNNAARYTHPGGRIWLTAECTPREFIVRVKDNGIGIPASTLKNVFSMFAQQRSPSDYSRGGLGIGLSLVEGIVTLHGGHVEAHSEGSGCGSEFVVRLPREDGGAAVARQSGIVASAGGSRRVLVVDDNVDAATTAAELLRLLGHQVEVAHDGGEALEKARQLRPETMLLDIGLPDIDGYEVARRVRAEIQSGTLPPMRLIALTGWGQDRDKLLSAEAGFDLHWVKPVGIEQLRGIADG